MSSHVLIYTEVCCIHSVLGLQWRELAAAHGQSACKLVHWPCHFRGDWFDALSMHALYHITSDALPPFSREIDAAFRFSVSDIYKVWHLCISTLPVCIAHPSCHKSIGGETFAGMINSGFVAVGDPVIIAPGEEEYIIKGL